MKSIWILGIVLTSLYSNCYSEEEIASAPSSEIAGVGVGVDVNAGGGYYGDDGVYYYYDDAPIIWIGPGLYYGVYFGDEYAYYRWYGRRYGRYYGRGYYGGWGYRGHGHGGHHG